MNSEYRGAEISTPVPRRPPPAVPAATAEAELRAEIMRLGPWHLDIEVTPETSTSVTLEAPPGTYPETFGQVPFISPRPFFNDMMKAIYPYGLEGRSVLDCACNCGAWLFWAREMGAGECFGFDIRSHWINQARFLLRNRIPANDRMRFEVCDLYALPQLELKPFNITIFHGIFYHLPDPMAGLKIAADLTGELLLLNTATRNDLPDGLLAISPESRQDCISGAYTLAWLPTGPNVLTQLLKWLGFPETRCVFWQKKTQWQPPEMGRIQMIASRSAGVFEHFDATRS